VSSVADGALLIVALSCVPKVREEDIVTIQRMTLKVRLLLRVNKTYGSLRLRSDPSRE